ncbi:hypothetical protein C4587_01320 [Candidatus Parcubacteria bacterium]|nr:MAG: hypothetical protein C4587_01320 [Candidatus Parcubacteria bacterium]
MKKKKISFLILLASLFVPALVARGQVAIRQRVFLEGTPVKLVNTTQKKAVGQLGTIDSPLILPGESFVWRVNSGFALFYSASDQMTLAARLCDSTKEDRVLWIPPEEASSPALGGIAIGEEYLRRSPSEDELEQRVREIKKLWDKQKILGRKELKASLDRWFEHVRDRGLFGIRTTCLGEVHAQAIPVYVRNDNIYHREVQTFFLRNDRGYYYLSRY